MKKSLFCLSAFGLIAISLAGCGDSGSGSTSTTTPPVVVPAFENQFGTQFGVLYRASANSDPANVLDSDVVALTLTADPVQVP